MEDQEIDDDTKVDCRLIFVALLAITFIVSFITLMVSTIVFIWLPLEYAELGSKIVGTSAIISLATAGISKMIPDDFI